MAYTRRRGFTITDLAVVLVCLLMLGTVVLQAAGGSRERANRVKCQSNLRQIGKGLLLYSADNKGAYPRGRADAADKSLLPAGEANPWPNRSNPTGNPFAAPVNDVSVAIFMLLKQGEMSSEVFVCPSSAQEKDTFENQPLAMRIGFTGPDNLSYSFTNPYPCAESISRGYKWSGNVQDAEFALAADRNDGFVTAPNVDSYSPPREQTRLNSLNHEREGQNVLYADGHVEWQSTSWVGAGRDCIYAPAVGVTLAGTNGPYAQSSPAKMAFPEGELGLMQPTTDLDSVMVPWAGGGFPKAPAMARPIGAEPGFPWWIIIAGALALILVVVVVLIVTRKKKPKYVPSPAPAMPVPPAEAAIWFRMLNNQPVGPFSMAQLMGMVRNGQLRPDDSIWQSGTPTWIPAGSVPGLFA